MQQSPAANADASRLKTSFSIIIACLNDEETIIECPECLTQSAPEAEILVLHGGKDRTYKPARTFARSHPNVVPVRKKNYCGSLIMFPTQ